MVARSHHPSDTYGAVTKVFLLRGLTPYIRRIITTPTSRKSFCSTAKLDHHCDLKPNGFPDTQRVMACVSQSSRLEQRLAPERVCSCGWWRGSALPTHSLPTKHSRKHSRSFVETTAESAGAVATRQRKTSRQIGTLIWTPQEGTLADKRRALAPVFQTDGLDALNAAVQIRGA